MATVTAQSLGRNSLFAALAQLWRIGSRLVLTPIILQQIGLGGYGTWVLLFSLSAYISLFDTSFGFAYSKYTAEYDRRGDYRTLAEIIGAGIISIGSMGLVALLATAVFRYPILEALQVPETIRGDSGIALVIVMFCLFLRMSFGCTFQILGGLQRIDLRYKLEIFASFVEFCTALVLLVRGWGILGLALGHLTGQVSSTIWAWVLCKRIAPNLRISVFRCSREGFRLILALGGKFQLLTIVNVAAREGIKILLSVLLGVGAVGIYNLAIRLLQLGSSLSQSLIGPLMPAFANLYAGNEKERWERLFVRSSKVIAALGASSLAFIALFADQALLAWTGEAFPRAAWTIRVLATVEFLLLLTGVASASLRARGVLGPELAFSTAAVVALLLCIYPFYQLAEYRGIIFALLLSRVVFSVGFLAFFFREGRRSIVWYARDVVLRVAVCSAVAFGAVYWSMARYELGFAFALGTRWGTAAEILVWSVPYLLITAAGFWRIAFEAEERAMLSSFVVGRMPGWMRSAES
jgi:O-antigen/teichoic acid export membrane protein